MADEPAYVDAFKQFMKTPGFMDIIQMEEEFYGESARATCILQGAMIELAIEAALKGVFKPDLSSTLEKILFNFEGVLGTFASKVNLAYALSIFGPKSYHDLGLIRLMRNEFAHSRKPATFETTEVGQVCLHLQIPDTDIAMFPDAYWRNTDEEFLRPIETTNAKRRFLICCHTIACRLLEFGHRNEKRPLDSSELP
jgi:hypothetical protein